MTMRDLSLRTVVGAGVLWAAALGSGCASAPPARPAAPTIPFEQKMAWMLQLEDRRILRIEPPPPSAPVAATAVRGRKQPAPAAVAPAGATPDLTVLVTDPEARIRRRAAMAIGR